MQLKYGSYTFESNACDIQAQAEAVRNDSGVPLSVRKTIQVRGVITTSGQADCTQKMNALVSALSTPYRDLVFYQDSGAVSATSLLNAGSISGVVITHGPSFLKNSGGEYSNFRTFEFTAEAEYPLAGTAIMLMSFRESLKFGGGGPVRNILLAVNGAHQPQTIYPSSVFTAVQSGEAVGYRTYPLAPGPIWPFAQMESPDIGVVSPKRRARGQYEGFAISWEYRFKSLTPLNGVPNIWI